MRSVRNFDGMGSLIWNNTIDNSLVSIYKKSFPSGKIDVSLWTGTVKPDLIVTQMLAFRSKSLRNKHDIDLTIAIA